MKSTTNQVSTSPGIPPDTVLRSVICLGLFFLVFGFFCFFFTSTTVFISHIATAGQFQENLIYSAPPGEYKREYLNHDKVSNHRDGRRELI